ncbi:MAG TPA: hypothetical protein VK564_03830 [Thermodesulfobacteriota bacterium]|nr:hypothetical protein [Thermodesulfobacteriota bacterium]
MTRSNAMLISNGISNLIGIFVVHVIRSGLGYEISGDVFKVSYQMNVIFIPFSFAAAILITLAYEAPIRRFLNMQFEGGLPHQDLKKKATRRLLNEPFFLICLDMGIWLSAAVIVQFILISHEAGEHLMFQSFFLSFNTGLITTTVAFFVFEFVLQRRVFPFFFPAGPLGCAGE